MEVRLERAEDQAAVGEVNRLAFGREEEGRLVEALRAGGHARLSLVAEDEGRIVGHILFSGLPIVKQRDEINALALAPMAVIPQHQRRGIGSMLVREGLRTCAERGHRIVIVVGHPGYYPRFGFSARLAERLTAPLSGDAFMALELSPGALEDVEGEVAYPPPFRNV
jgi:putative acetyltransferase